MSNPFVERVVSAVRAKLEEHGEDGPLVSGPNNDVLIDGWVDLGALVRAAVEAMREPGEDMIDAATCARGGRQTVSQASLATWEAMIEAALTEGSTASDQHQD